MSGEDEGSVYDETLSRASADAEAPARDSDLPATRKTVRTAVIETDSKEVIESSTRTDSPPSPANVEYEVYSVQPATVSSEEESLSAKAREAGRSFKDLAQSVARRTRDVTEQKVGEMKSQAAESSTVDDARDIQKLGEHVDGQVQVFDNTMLEIGRQPYQEQERMLTGYHKLLEEQINVIDARLELARRLKPA